MTQNTLKLIDEVLTQGGYSRGIDSEALESEAALIAAAPDLLAALQWLVDEADEDMPEQNRSGSFIQSLIDARAAIAKAKGN